MGFALTALLAYVGLRVLSSSIPLLHKVALNSILGLCALYILSLCGKVYVSVNIFTAVVLALCGPAGLMIAAFAEVLAG